MDIAYVHALIRAYAYDGDALALPTRSGQGRAVLYV